MIDSLIIEPETVTHAKKQAAKQRQLERRGIAREFLREFIYLDATSEERKIAVRTSLEFADELLDQTKVDEP